MTHESPRRVWAVSELYHPELTSTGYFMTGIAEGLAREFPVSVICGQPTYAVRGSTAARREVRNDVSIFRVRGTTFDRRFLPARLLNILTVTLSMFLSLLRHVRRGDLVIVVTNPPSGPYVARLAAWVKGASCVLVMHDVYPDAMIVAGMISRTGFAARTLGLMAAALLRGMRVVSVLGRDMAALVKQRAPGVEVAIIPNWADDDMLIPEALGANPLRASLGLGSKFVVLYAGNMGVVQDIEGLADVAARVQNEAPEVHFLFLGSGKKRPWFEQEVARRGLKNVTVVGERPRDEQATFLRAGDVSVVTFVPGMRGVGVPSRLYNMMAAGRPLVAAVDADSEPGLVIAEEQAGWVVRPGDPEGLAQAILHAARSPGECAEKGQRAAAAVRAKYKQSDIVARYVDMVRAL